MPAWLVPLPGWSQSEFLIRCLCSRAPGGNLYCTSHVGKRKTSAIKQSCVEQQGRKELGWYLQEGLRKQVEVCSARLWSTLLVLQRLPLPGVRPCPLGKVLLSHCSLESRALCAPSPGAAGTGLTSSPSPSPAQGSMRTSQGPGSSHPAGGLGLAQYRTAGTRKEWAQHWLGEPCHLSPRAVAWCESAWQRGRFGGSQGRFP